MGLEYYELDRIDPYGNYEPGNCRWVTRMENMHNQRKNHEFYKTYLSLEPVVLYRTFWSRVKRLGWEVGKAATTKIRTEYRHNT